MEGCTGTGDVWMLAVVAQGAVTTHRHGRRDIWTKGKSANEVKFFTCTTDVVVRSPVFTGAPNPSEPTAHRNPHGCVSDPPQGLSMQSPGSAPEPHVAPLWQGPVDAPTKHRHVTLPWEKDEADVYGFALISKYTRE